MGTASGGAVAALSSRAIVGRFYKRLEETQKASWAPRLAFETNTDQESETHKWLGMSPVLRKWIGSRHKRELRPYGVVVTSDKYEASLEVDVDDLRRDKTGQVLVRIGDMGRRTAILPQKMLTDLILANGNAYDGKAFFANNHVVGESGTINNTGTSAAATGTTPTAAEMKDAVLASVQAVMGFKDDTGEPLNADAQEFLLMVPVSFWAATQAALRDQFVAASTTNTLVSVMNSGQLRITAVMNPRLTGADKFFMFRTDVEVKPFIFQDEVVGDLKVLAEGSDYEFHNDKHLYGVKRISGAGYGMFEMAFQHTFS